MKRAILVVFFACGSSEPRPHTEVAITPLPSVSASAPAPSTSPSSSAEMNAEAPPDNDTGNALVIQMTPKLVHQGPPVVHMSRDTTEIGFARDAIQRVIRHNLRSIRACFEAMKPAREGRVVLRFTVDATGTVSSARATSSTLASTDVVTCVTNAFKALQFPEQRASLTVTYPILFQP